MLIYLHLYIRMSATAVQDLEYWSKLHRYSDSFAGVYYRFLQRCFPSIHCKQEDFKLAHLGEQLKGSTDPFAIFCQEYYPTVLRESKRNSGVADWNT